MSWGLVISGVGSAAGGYMASKGGGGQEGGMVSEQHDRLAPWQQVLAYQGLGERDPYKTQDWATQGWDFLKEYMGGVASGGRADEIKNLYSPDAMNAQIESQGPLWEREQKKMTDQIKAMYGGAPGYHGTAIGRSTQEGLGELGDKRMAYETGLKNQYATNRRKALLDELMGRDNTMQMGAGAAGRLTDMYNAPYGTLSNMMQVDPYNFMGGTQEASPSTGQTLLANAPKYADTAMDIYDWWKAKQ